MSDIRNEKADIIRYAMQNCRITDPASALMIGDRKHDVIGARQNGLQSVGVLFGYGSYEELTSAGATYIAEKPADILAYV